MYDEDLDYYDELENAKKFSAKKIVKLIFKLIAGIIIVGTFALIFGRIWLMSIPASYTGFSWTDGAVEAFNGGGLDVKLHTPSDSYDSDGLYNISNVALCETLDEVQMTVRYNSRSTVNTLMSKYELAERPVGEVFVYILSDGDGNVYTDYSFSASSNPLYEFRRLIFTGIDLTDVSTLYLDVYYGEDVSTDSPMHMTYVVYDKSHGFEELDITSVGKCELTFSAAPVYVSKLDA